jgi:hypothetical protein
LSVSSVALLFCKSFSFHYLCNLCHLWLHSFANHSSFTICLICGAFIHKSISFHILCNPRNLWHLHSQINLISHFVQSEKSVAPSFANQSHFTFCAIREICGTFFRKFITLSLRYITFSSPFSNSNYSIHLAASLLYFSAPIAPHNRKIREHMALHLIQFVPFLFSNHF